MEMGKNIQVNEKDFREALEKLDTMYSNLLSEKHMFNSICADLLEDWDGKSADQAEYVLKNIMVRFQRCVNDFQVLKKDMAVSLEEFIDSDKIIAERIDENIVVK